MKNSKVREAYVKWLSARILLQTPRLPIRLRQKLQKRERKYADARHYSFWQTQLRPSNLAASYSTIKRSLFIDVTQTATETRIHGISRVVNKMIEALLQANVHDFNIEPIKYDKLGQCWRLATQFKSRFACVDIETEDEPIIAFNADDVFLGLDWNTSLFDLRYDAFEAMKVADVDIIFVVYDLMPLRHSTVYSPRFIETFRRWIFSAVEISDGLLCISQSVANDVQDLVIDQHEIQHRPKIDHFYLGSDIVNNAHTDISQVKSNRKNHVNVLMVGTVQPLKGHLQALEAFRILWQQEIDVSLTIIGRQGWLVEDLVSQLRHESKHGKLIWITNADDSQLADHYRNGTVFLAASQDEGFGLPPVEAARYGLPIIARNMPVYREILNDGAYYFSGKEPETLAIAIRNWITLYHRKEHPFSNNVKKYSWQQSSAQLLDQITEISSDIKMQF